MSEKQAEVEVIEYQITPFLPDDASSVEDEILEVIKDVVYEAGFQEQWDTLQIKARLTEQTFPVGAPIIVAVVIAGGGALEVGRAIRRLLAKKYHVKEHARYRTARDPDEDDDN